jgi:hypothetical protein
MGEISDTMRQMGDAELKRQMGGKNAPWYKPNWFSRIGDQMRESEDISKRVPRRQPAEGEQ